MDVNLYVYFTCGFFLHKNKRKTTEKNHGKIHAKIHGEISRGFFAYVDFRVHAEIHAKAYANICASAMDMLLA